MMCAFMTPVVKNDWEIFPTNKSRQISGSSQSSNARQKDMLRPRHTKRIGELRSMSYNTCPCPPDQDLQYSKDPTRAYHLSTRNSRNASHASFTPQSSGLATPSRAKKGHCKTSSTNSLNNFHNKVMDRLRNVLHIKREDEEGEEKHDDDDNATTKEEKNKSSQLK